MRGGKELDAKIANQCVALVEQPEQIQSRTNFHRWPKPIIRINYPEVVLHAGNGPIALDPLGGRATITQDGMITQGGRQIGAIGLFSYVREDGGAPMVVSKGKDFIALKIREIAEQHSIPIVEDKSLARSMYDGVGVDRPIPPEFYKAVAEIIHILYAKGTPKAYAK
jgi:type III secretion system FlhB-like substrate exporter